jgi:hypothetical protein
LSPDRTKKHTASYAHYPSELRNTHCVS